jgi:hypothetical protein
MRYVWSDYNEKAVTIIDHKTGMTVPITAAEILI